LRNMDQPTKAGVPALAQIPGRHASSIGSASESSHGLMGSERGRRHPHHRD